MKDKLKIRILSIISIVFLCIGTTVRSFQNDTFYTIKFGEYIYKYGIDMMDHFCWVKNLPYTYPHWLYDLLIYYIYHSFGYMGIYLCNIFLFVCLILVVYFLHLRLHKNEFLAFFVSLFTICCLCGFATARAQLPSLILFLLEFYFILMLIKEGKNRYIFYLVFDSWLIANIHGTSWLFYFILFLPFFGEEIIYKLKNKIIYKKVIVHRIPYIKKLIISFILSFMMGIFTPGRICYSYVFRVMLGDSQSYIIEHAPLVIIHHPTFIAIVLVLLLILIFTNTKVYLRELFMIVGLMVMCFMSVRHLAFFYSIGVLCISIICVRALKNSNDKTLDTLVYLIIKKRIIYVSILFIILIGSYSKFIENEKKIFVPKKDYPVDAVKYIKKNLDYKSIRLYNDYNVGSYLLFNDIPVFVDSRSDLYLKEFTGVNIFDDSMNIYKDYEKKFKKYGVEYVLVSKSDVMFKLLDKDIQYDIIYKDKYYGLFKNN